MKVAEVASRPESDAGVAPVRRFVVIVGEAADEGPALQIDEPARLMRVWSLLQATSDQLDAAALPPEGVPGLQRQLRVIRRELEQAVSPPLAAELRRILPSHDLVPSAGALRIECAVLMGWTGSLVVQMLGELASAQERAQRSQPGRARASA